MLKILPRTLKPKNASLAKIVLGFHTGQEKLPRRTKTLKEKLEDMRYKDPELYFKVNIGLPTPPYRIAQDVRKRAKQLEVMRKNKDLERASRNLTLEVDYDEITEEWMKSLGPKQTYTMADHYGIYDDLFGDAYFIPYVALEIGFPLPNDSEAPVYRGNIVKPAEALSQPSVRFKADDNTLWTLVLTNPDGHLTQANMEYVHWFIGNIPGHNVSKGDVIFDYLQPFPPRGIGFQRYVFILYKQEGKIDYSDLKGTLPRLELKDRSFNTLEFYRQRQDDLTPAGLAFFQSDWDHSVIKTFHETLNMEEPIFEYDFDISPINKQEWFPKKQPFNLYIDRYRDPRDIAKEYVLEKSKNYNPFVKPEKPFPYQNIFRFDRDEPSWYTVKVKRDRIGTGRIADQKEEEYE